jgi:hypothetical protein
MEKNPEKESESREKRDCHKAKELRDSEREKDKDKERDNYVTKCTVDERGRQH